MGSVPVFALPRCQVPVDEPSLLQVSHAARYLNGVLTQSVDQHRALRMNASQTIQQRTQRSQLSHLRGRIAKSTEDLKTEGANYK